MITTYQSDVKLIDSSEEKVFQLLGDLNNLHVISDADFVKGKLKILSFNKDACLLELNKVGRIGFEIKERLANKLIKFETSELPVKVYGAIQVDEISAGQTHLQLIMEADLTWTMKMMLNRQIERGINQFADFFADFINTSLNTPAEELLEDIAEEALDEPQNDPLCKQV